MFGKTDKNQAKPKKSHLNQEASWWQKKSFKGHQQKVTGCHMWVVITPTNANFYIISISNISKIFKWRIT